MPQDGKVDIRDALLWYRVPLLLGVISILLIALSITIFIKTYQNQEPIRFSSDSEVQGKEKNQDALIVDIRGAVVYPGVYELPVGVRVEDALVRAGGITEEADLVKLEQVMNRAAKLVDGAKLYVPRLDDEPSLGSETEESLISVNLNTAALNELEAISGIGPVTASKIISGRPYQRLEELVERNIIGQSLFSKIREVLVL